MTKCFQCNQKQNQRLVHHFTDDIAMCSLHLFCAVFNYHRKKLTAWTSSNRACNMFTHAQSIHQYTIQNNRPITTTGSS